VFVFYNIVIVFVLYNIVTVTVLYNIVILFVSSRNLKVKIKKCVNEIYSRVRVGKYLFVVFPIKSVLKKGDALSPTFFKFALEYVFRMGHFKKDGLKLICTHQSLVFSADVSIFERKLLTVKKSTAAFLFVIKENGM
jgi:hypothetical protein